MVVPEKGRTGDRKFKRTEGPGATVGSREAASKVERELNVAINKTYAGDGERKRVFLDELDPDDGNYATEPVLECGIACGVQETLFGEDDAA